MTTVATYPAWFFGGADDVDEVNREYDGIDFDEEGYVVPPDPDLVADVQVIAAEVINGIDSVWFIRDGELMSRPSWMVRVAKS